MQVNGYFCLVRFAILSYCLLIALFIEKISQNIRIRSRKHSATAVAFNLVVIHGEVPEYGR